MNKIFVEKEDKDIFNFKGDVLILMNSNTFLARDELGKKILKKAGNKLWEQCKFHGALETSSSKLTVAGNNKFNYIIHNCLPSNDKDPLYKEKFEFALENTFNIIKDYKFKSIALIKDDEKSIKFAELLGERLGDEDFNKIKFYIY